ncbi:MAG: tetratricopeptide repeat protein [Ruminococcus sp.]|nr:tetratricopeptide repeat protein [Ruminococcus sp.]
MKVNVEEYTVYRTLTRLTEDELNQINFESGLKNQKCADHKKYQRAIKICGLVVALLIFFIIFQGDEENKHASSQQTVSQNSTVSSELNSMDEELADIVTRIDELCSQRIEVSSTDLEPWVEYAQNRMNSCMEYGYVGESIAWAQIKLDLENYINKQQGLPEVVDISSVVYTEADEELKKRVIKYDYAMVSSYSEGNTKYKAGNYEEAIPCLEEAASAEYGLAMVRLGQCYQKGYGVEINIPKAIEYYVQAIATNQEAVPIVLEEWGIVSEESILDEYPATVSGEELFRDGIKYHLGDGVEKDDRKAVKCFKAAATKGYYLAYCYLGCCYINNIGVGEKDCGKAASHFKLGAEYGEVNAISWLGYCYIWGFGVELNYTKAVQYLESAIALGDAQALHWLGFCYENGYDVTQDEVYANSLHEKAYEMLPNDVVYEEAIYEGPVYEGLLHGDTLFWQMRIWCES